MQRAILQVGLGPLHGTKRVLAPGDKLSVGKRGQADFGLPDELISPVHFEIAWDGSICTLEDLNSRHGTFLSGEKVSIAELDNASWIRAGGSDFFLFLEEATPPPIDPEVALLDAEEDDVPAETADWLRLNRDKKKAALMKRDERAQKALGQLEAIEEPLFAVLDAARSERIRTLLQESVEQCRSLYEGTEGDTLAHVAPYLVSLPTGSRLLRRLVLEGWEKRWGSYLTTSLPFKEVRTHLRRFLMVTDADTKTRFYFRFYDPGVLRAFFPTATVRQASSFFRGLTAYYAEDERGRLARFEPPKGGG